MTKVRDKVSKREVRNMLTFYAGGTNMEAPVKRGPQAESSTNEIVAEWRNEQSDLLLERNKRRLAVPVGYHQAIMLGWLVDGSSDWVGHKSITITPAMVGKKIAVPLYIESKRRDGGSASDAQDKFLNAAKDAGAMAGIARSKEDCHAIVSAWWERMIK